MDEKALVLVVDDDISLLKMAEAILAPFYRVSLARSGGQALRFLQGGGTPDLILLDIEMPELDGYQTLALLRGTPGGSQVPVIFLTGLTAPQSEVMGLRAGASDYITKPFVRDILLARLEVHMQAGRQRRQAAAQGGVFPEEKFRLLAQCLTETEQKVARLLAQGRSNREIGEELGYAYSYIKKVSVVIYDKLGVSGRAGLRKLIF